MADKRIREIIDRCKDASDTTYQKDVSWLLMMIRQREHEKKTCDKCKRRIPCNIHKKN